MKKFYILIILISGTYSLIFSQVRINMIQPADVNIGNHITSIAIIDRTEPEKGWVNVLEGIATGEGVGLDKEAREHTMSGLNQVLSESPKFTVINTPVRMKTPLVVGGLPAPLPWPEVDKICKQYNCNALLSLEFFDSDFIVTKAVKDEVRKDKDGKEYKVKVHYAEGVGNVKIGYRLYDPVNKNIIDQVIDEKSGNWNASGKTAAEALASLISRKNAINNISRNSGMYYAERISPHWITVYRHYYRKPRKDISFATGVRNFQTNNWENALDYFLKATKSGHKKTAKRAYFNVALSYEILGDLEKARKWATDAYTIYNLKKARSYVGILDNRIWEEERLKQQME